MFKKHVLCFYSPLIAQNAFHAQRKDDIHFWLIHSWNAFESQKSAIHDLKRDNGINCASPNYPTMKESLKPKLNIFDMFVITQKKKIA